MYSRSVARLAGLVCGLALFVGSFLATVTVAGIAIGPSRPPARGRESER